MDSATFPIFSAHSTRFLVACSLTVFSLSVYLSTMVSVVRAESSGEPLSYSRDVRPILSDKCFQCHGPDAEARQADLRLDVRGTSGGVSGAEAVLADLEHGELMRRITIDDPDERMPPQSSTRQLSESEIDVLSRWVTDGAPYESHWAFVSPTRPALPKVRDTKWPTNGVDYFVLSRLEREGLAPAPRASVEALARRASLDLIGLPPTLETLVRLTAGASYRDMVDDLLKSPRYGEHWATMWLDAARYADTNGYNNDTPRYNWKYRDWVMEALNRNMPYDQFVTEQLAGDLLPNATLKQRIATGFNRNHNVTSEGGIIDEEYRLEYVADRVHTTSMVFMALTIRCARCHDHKFDPISQREYYQLFSFFNQVPETGYHKEHVGNPHPVVSAPTQEQSLRLSAASSELEVCLNCLSDLAETLTDEEQETHAEFQRLTELQAKLTEERDAINKAIPTAMVMRDLPEPRATFMLKRGAYDQPTDAVGPDVPAVLSPFPLAAERNRLGFAQWLTSRTHPLTARVIVNRIWAEMFGRGLVTTLEDFGTQGTSPSHPELLDWLAIELVDSGWDMHHILRLIATSSTYRQTTVVTPELLQRDPHNELLARGPRFRMKGEMIRDSALFVSGLLVHKIGGPSVRPYQPAGLWEEVAVADHSYSGGPYVQDHGENLYRRSVYTWWKRTCPPPNLNTLDAPEREFCRVQRSRTNTPLQALVLMNDPTFVEAARKLAERVLEEGGEETESRVNFGFRLATARLPNNAERKLLMDCLNRSKLQFGEDHKAAQQLLAVGEAEVSKSDLTELAAYTTVASIIFNLDEFLTK